MIKIEHMRTYGWMSAVHGMRNPMNSWDKSDSYETYSEYGDRFFFGENDLSLAKKLTQAGPDHRKFLRQIFVSMDITAPLYWWKEFDTYKVGTVANSCSTMHKIHDKEFTLDDFSHEYLIDDEPIPGRVYSPFGMLDATINNLNKCREMFLKTKDKRWWYSMIQLLPSSYNQLRTVTLNYEVLLNMYHARKGHKLDEWRKFCDTVAHLPYFNEFIAKELNNHDNQNPTADA